MTSRHVPFIMLFLLGCSQQVMQEPVQVNSLDYNEKAIDRFIEDLLATEGRRVTGFTEAARWGRIEVIEDLLDSGMQVDATDEFGRTALILAAMGGQLEVMQFLIERGSDVNFRAQESGMTPLLALLATLHSEAVYYSGTEFLIEAGANISIFDSTGKTTYDWAKQRVSEERIRHEFLKEFFPKEANSKEELER